MKISRLLLEIHSTTNTTLVIALQTGNDCRVKI